MVKLPYHCEKCGETVKDYRGCACVRIETGCGCIFCDIGLDPDVVVDGVKFHHITRRGNILCERKAEPDPRAAFLYSAK